MRLLYFSPVAWDSYEQRPHYFVRDFLAAGGDSATWINPYAARLPGWRDLTRSDLRDPPLVLPRPNALRVVDPGGWPVDPLPGGTWLNARLFWGTFLDRLREESSYRQTMIGIGRPTALALEALEAMRPVCSFFDAMDDFPEFYRGRSREATRRVERDIARRVNRIFVSSTHLFDKFQGAGSPVTLLRNGFDMTLLPAFTGQRPSSAHFGFIGCLGQWFDWELVLRLAEAVAPAPVTLAGPQASRTPAALPSNIILRPRCAQAEGARLLQTFTAGLIPFVRNRLTAGVDPIKFYQYRAAGLPVLSTRFGDMAARGADEGTFFLDDRAGIRAAVDAAAAYRPDPSGVARFRATHTWAARFREGRPWEPN